MEWFTAHVDTIITVVSLVVGLTPTQKDDGVLGRVVNLFRVVAGLVKSDKELR